MSGLKRPTIEHAAEVIGVAENELNNLCNGRRRFTMSIPVRDDDTDMVIDDAFYIGRELIRIRDAMLSQNEALNSVLVEREAQNKKWGEQNHDPFTYLAILTEEVGELSQAALHNRFGGCGGDLGHLREEAVQTAAVALAIVECLDRCKWKWPEVI